MRDLPSQSDWSALYEAAITFKQTSPWEWVDNEDLFAIENPVDRETGYCSILGSGGEEFGLAVLLGDRGFEMHTGLVSGRVSPEDFDAHLMVPSLSMLLVHREDFPKEDRAVVRSLGLTFRGRNAWPLFRSQRSGYAPWFLDREEAVFFTAVLRQGLAVAERVRNGWLDLSRKTTYAPVFTRCLSNGDWRDEWRKPKKPDRVGKTDAESIGAANEALLSVLRGSASKRSGAWELDIFALPVPVGPPGSRRFFPICFMAADRNRGVIVGANITEPWLTLPQKQEQMIRILQEAGRLPRDIWVKSVEMRAIVEPIVKDLGTNLHVGRLTMLEEAKASLGEFISRPKR